MAYFTILKRRYLVVAGFLFSIFWLAYITITPNSQAALPMAVGGQALPSLADMVEKAIPAVVNIATSSRIKVQENPLMSDPFFRRFFDLKREDKKQKFRENKSLGSGVIVDAKKGLVLTNYHVIKKADKITVTLNDGRIVRAEIVGVDPETDVGVLRLLNHSGLTALPLGNSNILRVGDFAVAIGNPFGLGQTVTSGIISALRRKGLGLEGYEDFIQTDASINPGNSGGALVNLRGELIGINTAILARGGGNVGIGFAIPIEMAQSIMSQLVEYGEVRRGLLGVRAQDLTAELAAAFGLRIREGAVITRAVIGSAADKAGLTAGDIIIQANDRKIHDSADLRNVIGLSRIGERVSLVYIRNGKRKEVTVVVREPTRARINGHEIDRRFNGSVLETASEKKKNEGVEVMSVKYGSLAWQAGLREKDVILSVNRLLVTNFEELKNAVSKDKRQMLINIQRGEERLFMLVR
ncbi:MAG: DegQ family serine endoprotease [Magnetococcales bacterium]|nr:DegQ family serine endoprotease [Magnetococcales bacterium]